MWRGIVFSSALGILLFPLAATAQEGTDAGQGAKPLRLEKFLRLHVTGGRIQVRDRDGSQSRMVTSGQPESPYRQQLQLQVRPPCVVVQYEAVDPDGQLTLRLCERRKLLIERVSADPSRAPSVRYEQPQTGPVTLTVAGTTSREFSAPSLWHLFLSQPAACREHLTPLLEGLAPDWQLDRQADEVEAELLAAATDADVRGQELAWQKLVDNLASDNFRQRQEADEGLRSSGQSAAAFLARLDRRSLSAEQRLRIDAICRSLADAETDTPKRAAAWLVGDRGLWLARLGHPQVEQRMAAAEHLSRLVGRPIAFDPQADEKTRQAQLAEATRRYGPKP